MATRAVAGDFLRDAARQLHAAAVGGEPAAKLADLRGICRPLGQAAVMLAPYLEDTYRM